MRGFSISILSEEMVSDAHQAQINGGVWLKVDKKNRNYLKYLEPDKLIAWIEGKPIKKYVYFENLGKKQNQEVLKLFDQELHRLFK